MKHLFNKTKFIHFSEDSGLIIGKNAHDEESYYQYEKKSLDDFEFTRTKQISKGEFKKIRK
jgi:hypothetical protein